MARLYELTDEYVSLIASYEDAETEQEREDILQKILDCGDDIAAKAENYAKFVKNEEADAKALATEIARLQEKKRVAENAVKRTKEYLLMAMEVAGATEIQTSIGKWRIQNNPPSVNVVDASKIPERFLIQQEPAIDKKAMLTEFRNTGEEIDGVEITQTEGVRFR